ncbi:MAG: AMP-binding protein [Acidimicrobiales bacterium]
MLDSKPQLWAMIEARAALSPDKVLVVDDNDRSLTFGDYRAQAERVAAHLHTLGVHAETRVAWQLPTWIESMVLVGALARLGVTQIPMLPIYREREVRFILRQTEPQVFIVPGVWRGFDYRSLADQVTAELPNPCVVMTADRSLPEDDPSHLPPPPPTLDDPTRWVFYTSGTTGDPKGALHSDAAILAGAAGVIDSYAITERDRYPIVFPFTHVGGIGMLFIQLATGCGAIAVEQFDAERTPPILAKHGLTIAAGGTPLALIYLQQQRKHPDTPLFPDVRFAMTGAATTPPGLHAELRRELGGTGALACYGLTEAPFLTVNSYKDTDEQRSQTVGRPIGGAVLRVIDAEGLLCPPGESGEVRAKGPQICRGYLDSTRNVDAFDDEGWFRTGDLGRLDENGFLTITGRLKDIIIRKGENIAAKEIEDILYEHPSVADIAVIGLPDDLLGERCCAVVVLRDGATLDLSEIVTYCRDAGLATQKIPEQLEILPDLPRNASGKVLKFKLQEQFAAT